MNLFSVIFNVVFCSLVFVGIYFTIIFKIRLYYLENIKKFMDETKNVFDALTKSYNEAFKDPTKITKEDIDKHTEMAIVAKKVNWITEYMLQNYQRYAWTFKSFKRLRKDAEKLTYTQKLYIKYYQKGQESK